MGITMKQIGILTKDLFVSLMWKRPIVNVTKSFTRVINNTTIHILQFSTPFNMTKRNMQFNVLKQCLPNNRRIKMLDQE